jgi:hypothetical protein
LSGFCLRPGYGYLDDPRRIEEVWRIFSIGLKNKKDSRVIIQWCIFWRRISGGLTQERQEMLFDLIYKEINKDEGIKKEAFRTLSVLERVSLDRKLILVKALDEILGKGRIDEVYAWCFGRVCNRIPVLGEQCSVVPARFIEEIFINIEKYSWSDLKMSSLAKSMLLVARMSTNIDNNLSENIRFRIVEKLKEAKFDFEVLKIFKEYIPYSSKDENSFFGEDLPIGLSIFNNSIL